MKRMTVQDGELKVPLRILVSFIIAIAVPTVAAIVAFARVETQLKDHTENTAVHQTLRETISLFAQKETLEQVQETLKAVEAELRAARSDREAARLERLRLEGKIDQIRKEIR